MYILGLRKLSGVPCSQQQQPYAVLAWITLTICSRPVVYILISKGYGFVQGSLAKGQFTLDTCLLNEFFPLFGFQSIFKVEMFWKALYKETFF